MLSYYTLHYRSSVERVDAYNRQVVYDEVGETRYACPHHMYILVLHDQIDLKLIFLYNNHRSSIEKAATHNTQAVYEEVGEARYACLDITTLIII